MICPYCGAEVPDGFLFCVQCGTAMPSTGDEMPAPMGSDFPAEPEPKGYAPEPDVPASNPYGAPASNPYDAPASQPLPASAGSVEDTAPTPAYEATPTPASYSSAFAQSPAAAPSGSQTNKTPLIIGVGCVAAIIVIAITLLLRPSGGGDASGANSGSATGNSGSTVVIENGESDASSSGATYPYVGNLVNGGHMAGGQSGDIFYADPEDGTDWDTKSIVWCAKNGSSKQILYEAPNTTINLYHLNPVDGYLVFNQIIDKQSTVVCVNTSTGKATTIDSCDDWSLCQVADGKVYYLKAGTIWEADLKGGNKHSITSVGDKTKWRIWNGALYTFDEKDASQIDVSSLNGSNRKTLYQETDGYTVTNAFPVTLPSGSDALVVLEGASGKDDFVQLVSDGKVKTLTSSSDSIERACAYDEGVVLTTKASNGKYYLSALSFTGGSTRSRTEVPYKGEVRYTCYASGLVVFGVVDGKTCSVCTFDLKTGDFNTIG